MTYKSRLRHTLAHYDFYDICRIKTDLSLTTIDWLIRMGRYWQQTTCSCDWVGASTTWCFGSFDHSCNLCGAIAGGSDWTKCKVFEKSFPIFRANQSHLKLLAELDACLITGIANFCDVWTSALAHLNEEAAGQLDVGKILTHHEVKSLTSDGKSRSVSGGSCEGLDEDVNQTDQFFGINELIHFTLHPEDGVLPIDEQQSVMWAAQMKNYSPLEG